MTLIEHYLINYLHLPKDNHVTKEVSGYLESKGYSVDLQSVIENRKDNLPLEVMLNNGKNTAVILVTSDYQNSVSILEFYNKKSVVSTLFYDEDGITGLRVTDSNKVLSIFLNSNNREIRVKNMDSNSISKLSIEYFLDELIDANLLLRAAHKEFKDILYEKEKSGYKKIVKLI